MPTRQSPSVEGVIEGFSPTSVGQSAAAFARCVVAQARPASAARAKAFLFAAAKLGDFATSIGREPTRDLLFNTAMVERFILCGTTGYAAGTQRTLRTSLRALARAVAPSVGPGATPLPRDRGKAPYSQGEIDAYLALAAAQPTLSRRRRAGGLIALGAGAGVVGTDLRSLRGIDVIARSGGLVVVIGADKPRVVPVLARYHEVLSAAAAFAGVRYVVGGDDPARHTSRHRSSPRSVAGWIWAASTPDACGRVGSWPVLRRSGSPRSWRRRGSPAHNAWAISQPACRRAPKPTPLLFLGAALSKRTRRESFEAILDGSGVPALLDDRMPRGGRPRQLGTKAVLLGVMLALDAGRPAQLEAAWRALSSLEVADQLSVGFATSKDGACRPASYRQLADTFSVLCRGIDPSPVPSFRAVPDDERALHLAAVRTGVDAEAKGALLDAVSDALLEASVPQTYKDVSSSLAVDWTDHETWSRPRPAEDPQPANDADASFGHAKRNAPGAKDYLFFGYYAQVATMVRDERGSVVPELVRRIALAAPSIDPAGVMTETLLRLHKDGVALGDVLADCGYSNRNPETFAAPLRRAGAALVVDLHPGDRGRRGTFEGAIAANGALFCPATPEALLDLGPLKRGATHEEVAVHDARFAELSRHKFATLSSPDDDGYQRVMCPAAAGKVRCPHQADSLALSLDHPSVSNPPAELPRCCAQRSITVAPQVNEKTRPKHDYPGPQHRASYARRIAAERTYASLADPSVGGIRRGWCRLFGRTKNTLMYALAVVVRNVRILESFEKRQAEEAQAAALGPRRRRRRRRQRDSPEPAEQPTPEVETAPG